MKGWKSKILKECKDCKYANLLVCKKDCPIITKLIKNLKNVDIPLIVEDNLIDYTYEDIK